VWSLPLLWLFLGPPILRLGYRSAEASLQGSVDLTNLVRVAWWVACGAWAAFGIYRHRRWIPALVREATLLHLAMGLYVITMYTSIMASPARMYSLVSAVMMTILVVAAGDVALRRRAGVLRTVDLFRSLFLLALVLSLAIVAGLVVAPGVVSKAASDGLRLTGGGIGDPALLGIVLVLLGLHLARGASGALRVGYGLSTALGLALLVLARGRTDYAAFVAAMVLMLLQRLVTARPRAAVRALGATSLLLAVLALTLVATAVSHRTAVLDRVAAYVVRDAGTLSTFSGRTAIAGVLVPAAARAPFGLGFAAGPRQRIMESGPELIREGVVAQRIGNAHDAYVEVFSGLGIVGAVGFLGLLLAVGVRIGRLADPDLVPLRALLVALLVHSITGSGAVLPFESASALLWIVVAVTVGTGRGGRADAARGRPVRASGR
jgi:hypothetical protein